MLYAFQGVKTTTTNSAVPQHGSYCTPASGKPVPQDDEMRESDSDSVDDRHSINEVLIIKHLLTQIFPHYYNIKNTYTFTKVSRRKLNYLSYTKHQTAVF